jgi:hypothetical protein
MNLPDPRLLPPAPDLSVMDKGSHMDAQIDYGRAVAETYQFSSVWSLDALEFSAIAFEGSWRVSYAQHWGPDAIVTRSMTNPTWLDLFAAADWAIERSGDGHHIFIEIFEPSSNGILELFTGS